MIQGLNVLHCRPTAVCTTKLLKIMLGFVWLLQTLLDCHATGPNLSVLGILSLTRTPNSFGNLLAPLRKWSAACYFPICGGHGTTHTNTFSKLSCADGSIKHCNSAPCTTQSPVFFYENYAQLFYLHELQPIFIIRSLVWCL